MLMFRGVLGLISAVETAQYCFAVSMLALQLVSMLALRCLKRRAKVPAVLTTPALTRHTLLFSQCHISELSREE